MANHISHASLPYPVKNARFTMLVPYLDADGDPTDGTSLDTEVSQDNGSFADAAEEVTLATGGRGIGMITLTGAEMNNSAVGVWFGCATAKASTATLYPRTLPILETGTAQAGAAGTITLASGASAKDLSGCIVRTTGGTGGGGTGGANNQARMITAYNTSTKVASIGPNWETNPSSDTTYDILLTDLAVNPMLDSPGVATLLTRITSTLFANITSLAQWLGLLGGKQVGNTTARTELRATGAGSGTFDETTDSVEALRDRGDAAWITATGFATAASLATTDGKVDAIKAKTDNLPTDPADASDIAAAFSSLNAKVDTIDDFLDTEIAAIKAKTDGLPSDPADASDIASAFGTVNSTLATIAGYIDTEIGTILSRIGSPGVDLATDLAAVKSVADAVKAKTDNLPSDPADQSLLIAAIGAVETKVDTVDTVVDAIKLVTDKLDDTLEDDGGTWRFTANALEEGPSGTGLDAAGVRAALGMASANMDTQLGAIAGYLDTEIAAIKAKTDNLPSDPADQSLLIAAISAVETKVDTIDDFLDTEVAAIKAKTDGLPSDPADQSLLIAAISAVESKVDTVDTVADAIKLVTDKLDDTLEDDGGTWRFTANALEEAPSGTGASAVAIADEVQTRTIAAVALVNGLAANTVNASALAADAVAEIQSGLASAANLATLAGYVDTEVAAIKAKTDNLPSDPADQSLLIAAIAALSIPTVDQIGDEIEGRTLTVGLASGALDDVSDAVWTTVIESGFTAEQIMRLCASVMAGSATGLENGLPNFKGLDGTTTRVAGTYTAGTRVITTVDGD